MLQAKQINTPILFIHGAWHGPWCWEAFFVPFFSRKFNTYNIELIGHSDTEKDQNINYLSGVDFSEDIKNKINNFEESPIIICHSMGGYLLQTILTDIRKPSAVIFLAPAPVNGALKPFLRILNQNPIGVLKAVLTLDSRKIFAELEVTKRLLFSESTDLINIENYKEKLQTESIRIIFHMLMNKYRNVISRKVPSLVIASTTDIISTQSEAREVAKFFNSDFHVFKNIGHDMMLDNNWEIVANYCLEWIESNVNSL